MEEEYELVEVLASELVHAFNVGRWSPHHRALQLFTTPSVKLVYLLVATYGPLSFTSIRRILSVSRYTVDRSLKELMASGFVLLDEMYMYRIIYPPRGDGTSLNV